MTSDTPHGPGGRHRRLAVTAVAGAVLFGTAALAYVQTSDAAFTDFAELELGTGDPGSAIGNPNRFDIVIADADGVLQDAATAAEAVVLPTGGAPAFSEATPVEFSAELVNRDPGIDGDLVVGLMDPDPVDDDLWAWLRFTVTLDGAAEPAIADASADEVNQAGIRFDAVEPGGTRTLRIDVVVEEGAGASVAGKSTALGLRVEGMSR